MKPALLLAALLAFGAPARAQISDNAVRIGVLNDQSSLYADIGGAGSVAAARLAAEDFGGRVLGKPIEITYGPPRLQGDFTNPV